MTLCTACRMVDLGITRILKGSQYNIVCPGCGVEDCVTEIASSEWIEEMNEEGEEYEDYD